MEEKRNEIVVRIVWLLGWGGGIYEGELSTGVGTIQGGRIHAPITRK